MLIFENLRFIALLFELKSALVEELFAKNANKKREMSSIIAFSIPSIKPPYVQKSTNTERLKFINSSYQIEEDEMRQVYSHCSSVSIKNKGLAALKQGLISTFGCILAG